MRKRHNILIWTSNDGLLELRDAISMKKRWHNTTKSFEGHTLTPSSKANTVAIFADSDELSLDARVQFICDEPDYAVFSNGLPILWYSNTTSRENKWIAPFNDDETKYRQSLRNAIEIIRAILPWLNEADQQDRLACTA
jgi:hypothetical protein